MAWKFHEPRHAKLYRQYRPVYPNDLYNTIFSYTKDECDGRTQWTTALDIGCGTGQGTLPLCDHFDNVIGVDQSQAQIDEAVAALQEVNDDTKVKVKYRLGVARDLSFQPDSTVDLITVATAVHWFDRDKFYAECLRVLRPGGVLAIYKYVFPALGDPTANECFVKYMDKVEVRDETFQLYTNDYHDLFDGFKTIFSRPQRIDTMSIERTLTVKEFVGYCSSTALYTKYRATHPEEPDQLNYLTEQLQEVFADGGKEKSMTVRWPVILLLGTKP